MAKSKLSLENSSLTWSEKRRYKVNAVVLYSGSNYQNLTGKNSEPGVGTDWFKVPDTTGPGGPVSTDTVTNNSNVAGATATDALNNLQAQFPGDYSKIVYVNNNNPNSATIFDLNNPPTTNDPLLEEDDSNLYIGLDESSWVYNSVSLVYETETGTGGKATSNFVLEGTNKDAGNNKNSAIERSGPVGVGTATKANHAVTKTQHDTKLNANSAITGATKTKITYDSKGLVTAGADATTADINDSANKRYVTDAQLTVIGNTSGTNSGNETASSIAIINHGAAAKTTLVDADEITGQDSASSFSLIRVTCLNLYNYLKTKFDTLYEKISNKSQDINADKLSIDKYPSTKETYNWSMLNFVRSYGIIPIGTFIPSISNISELTIVAPNTTYSFANKVLSVSKSTGSYEADEFVYSSYGSSCFESFDLEIIAVCRTVGLGLAPFLKSPQAAFKFNWNGRITSTGMAISSTAGNGTTWSDRTTSSSTITINVNDEVSFKLSRAKNKITYIVTNLSTSETISLSFLSSYNEVTNCQPTMFRYGFQVIGGAWDVTSFTAKTSLLKNIDNLFIGDSITEGFSTSDSSIVLTNSSSRYYDLVDNMTKSRFKNMNLSAGGATPNDMSGITNEVALINPKNVFVMLGTNSQDQSIYSMFIAGLVGLGVNVIPQTIPPTFGAFNTWLKGTYINTLDTCAQLFTGANSSNSTWNATYQGYSGHPNIAGHNTMYAVILNYLNTVNLLQPIVYATSVTVNSIGIAWSQSLFNIGYKIQVSTDGITFSDLATTAINVNSYSHTGLTTGQGYYYKVKALADSTHVDSGYSLVVSFKTEASVILGDFLQSQVVTNNIIKMNKKLPSGVDGWFKFTVGEYSIGQVDRVILGLRHDNTYVAGNDQYHNYTFYYASDSKIHVSSLTVDVAPPTISHQVNQWVRLRRTSGVVYYEYSNDNISWTVLASRADTSDLYAQLMFMVAATKIRSVTVSDGFVSV